MKRQKDNKKLTIGLVIVGFFVGFLVGITVFTFLSEPIINIPQETHKTSLSSLPSSTTIHVPAVDNQGNGVVAALNVQAITGENRALVNINQLLFWVDTQFSIRIAKDVAENITGFDLSKIDLIYTIETNASVIEGQSAGAALTIATIATLQNKTINPHVIITGTINPDGTIGPVGGILAKAQASKDTGATLFLVPEGQGVQTNYMPIQKCQKFGPITYCSTEYKTEKTDISKDVGIEVKEVSNIQEALKYFLT
jgi:uncharacterized protein